MKIRFLFSLLFACVVVLAAHAQTTGVFVVKVAIYEQATASGPVPLGFGFIAQVHFPPPASGNVVVTLQKPNGSETMVRDAAGTYSSLGIFLSKSALDAGYPDGTYTIQLSGAVNATYTATLTAASLPSAPSITNYAAAQSISTPSNFTLMWTPLSGGSAEDFVGLTIESTDGLFEYASPEPGEPGALTGLSTQATLNLPPNRQFTGDLMFIRASQFTPSSNALIVAGGASATTFSLRTTGDGGTGNPPVFSAHPVGRGVAAGDSTTFSNTVTGTGPFTYQWRHNGVDIAGATNATLTLPSVQSFQSGNYTVVVRNAGGAVTSNTALLTVTPVATAGSNARLVNLATRGQVGTDASALIPGFVLAGTGTKQVLIRAVGPGLTQLGLPANDVVADPVITLVSSNGVTVATNDDWQQAANAAAVATAASGAGAFALPAGSRDAAILTTLGPGAYTALVSGKTAAVGLAIVEVYDLDGANPNLKLVNIATRGLVGTDSRVLIPGFVVTGTAPRTYLIRGVGPSLAAFGQTGVIADPVLTVFQGSNVLFSNDDWITNSNVSELSAAARNSGAFELMAGSRDAALLVTLRPGAYTFQVAGKGTAGGIGLVEVYEVP